MYKDRTEAALLLIEKLQHYKNRDGVVLAVPRGGVPIGRIIANALGLPLEIILSKKIGHPFNKEYAIGALTLETRVLNEDIQVSEKYIEEETQRLRKLLLDRLNKYYQGRKPMNLKGKIVILVDDGIATGYTMRTTVDLVRHQQPGKIVLAVPVASPQAIRILKNSAAIDEVVCLAAPPGFYAVGQFYESFPQVTDEEVIKLMKTALKNDKKGSLLSD